MPESLSNRKLLYIALVLVVFGALLRLLPHPANFAPVGAIAIFGGAVLPRKLAWWLPLAVMAASDAVIGFYPVFLFTWAAFLLVGLFGMTLRRNNTWTRILLGSFGGALIFFFVSNFGVWVSSGMYAHTLSGFMQCYAMALPFFRNTLAGDLTYNTVLFGAFALATKRLVSPQPVSIISP